MKYTLLFLFVLITSAVTAQNFFKPIPKLKKIPVTGKSITALAVTPTGTTFWAFRPIVSAVTLYIDGDVQAAAGGGVSYQNITQDATTGRNYVNYAINFVTLLGGAISNNANNTDIEKFSLYASALNNTVGLGYGMARQQDPVTLKKKWKGGLAVVWTYNFNN